MQLLLFLHNFSKGYICYLVWATVIHLPSKKKWLRDIGYSMTTALDTRISNFGSQEWLWFYIWFTMTLYDKMRQILLQNATAILLQNATKVYCNMRQNIFYEIRQFCYKMWQLLKNVALITKYVSANTYLPQVSICCEISKTSN